MFVTYKQTYIYVTSLWLLQEDQQPSLLSGLQHPDTQDAGNVFVHIFVCLNLLRPQSSVLAGLASTQSHVQAGRRKAGSLGCLVVGMRSHGSGGPGPGPAGELETYICRDKWKHRCSNGTRNQIYQMENQECDQERGDSLFWF